MSSFDVQSPLPPRKPTISDGQEPVVADPVKETISNPPLDAAPIVNVMPTKNEKKIPLPLILGLAIVLIVLILGVVFKLLIPGLMGKTTLKETTLNYWGLWENGPIMQGIIDEFQVKNPGIKVVYKMVNKADYRSRLQSRLEKTGEVEDVPDIFRIHSSWVPMFIRDVAPIPSDMASRLLMDSDFYSAFREIKANGRYQGVPLMYDQLALFYNKQILESAQAQLPKTWWGLRKLALKLTVKDTAGQLTTAGAALGLTDNVDHWSDIVGLLAKQNGVDFLANDKAAEGKLKEVLEFYSNFKVKDGVWDETMPNSTTAFANGKVALYFGPSWRVFDLETINSNLKFEVTNVPQLPTLAGVDEKVESGEMQGNLTNTQWSTYWIEAVSSRSTKQAEAFKFLEFLANKESLQKLFAAAAQTRSFGEIYPRKSMKDMLENNPKIKPFIVSADNGTGWYLSSFTHDTGLNDEMIKYFGDAINGMAVKAMTADEVFSALRSGINQLSARYRLSQ